MIPLIHNFNNNSLRNNDSGMLKFRKRFVILFCILTLKRNIMNDPSFDYMETIWCGCQVTSIFVDAGSVFSELRWSGFRRSANKLPATEGLHSSRPAKTSTVSEPRQLYTSTLPASSKSHFSPKLRFTAQLISVLYSHYTGLILQADCNVHYWDV